MPDVLSGRGTLTWALAAAAVSMTGCGTRAQQKVLSPALVAPTAATAYPAGSPVRAAVATLIAVAYNDPAAVARTLAPSVHVSSAAIAFNLGSPTGRAVQALARDPKQIAQTATAARAKVSIGTGFGRLTVDLQRGAAGWRTSQVRLGAARLIDAHPLTTAHHPARPGPRQRRRGSRSGR